MAQMYDIVKTYVKWNTKNPFFSPIDLETGKITIGEMVKDLPEGTMCVGQVYGEWGDYFGDENKKVVVVLGQGFNLEKGGESGKQE